MATSNENLVEQFKRKSHILEVEQSAQITPQITPQQQPEFKNTAAADLTDEEEEEEEEEEKEYHQLRHAYVSQRESQYYCICGKLLKRYPPSKESHPSQSHSHISTPQAQTFKTAYRGFKQLVFARHNSITLFDAGDNEEEEDEEEDENKEQKLAENAPETQNEQQIETAPEPQPTATSNDVNDIENAITKHIELQQTNISKAPLLAPTNDDPSDKQLQLDTEWDDLNLASLPTQDFDQDDAETSSDGESDRKHSQSAAEEHSQTITGDAAQLVIKKRIEDQWQKNRDGFLNVSCHSCECKMNDPEFVRYECDNRKCYRKKYKDLHIQYCSNCFKQLSSILHLKKHDEGVIFHEDGFEVRSCSDRLEGEHSVTDTDTITQTQPSQSNLSDSEASPGPNEGSTGSAAARRDFYKFQVKLKKMVIDHCDKTVAVRKTKGGTDGGSGGREEEEKKEDIEVLQPMKAVVCYPSDDTDPDRVVYISCELNHLSISERWETGNAECDIQLTVKLYWMLSESDYIKYNRFRRKNKKRNRAFNDGDIQFSFKPEVNFYRAIGNRDQQQQQHIHLIEMQSFFGDEILKNLHFERESPKKKDVPWDHIRKLMFGYMAEVTYYCEVRVFEPFEIENFPYDCQDIPIIIEPTNFRTLAPAYPGQPDHAFVTITGDATNLGRWSMENTVSEFNNKRGRMETNILRIMLKLKRRSSPYLLEHVFLIMAVCFISLTAFTIDSIADDVKHERLAIILGLILTLIFIDLPPVPIVTLLHWYFYASFLFLIVMALHFSFETYYSPMILKIEDRGCYDDEAQCWWYQSNNYNLLWFSVFGTGYVLYHVIFMMHSVSVNAEENRKLQMNSEQVKEIVEDEQWKISTPAVFKVDESKRKITYQRYNYTDVFGGYPKVEEEEDDGRVDRVRNVIMQQHRQYNGAKSQMSEVMERLSVLLLVTGSFVVLPLTASVLQFVLLRLETCVPDENIEVHSREHLVMIILSGIQSVLCLLSVLFWFGCCAGQTVQSLFLYSLPIASCVILTNYVLCIRSFAVYFYDGVICGTAGERNKSLEYLLFWLFLAWIVIYAGISFLSYIKLSFPRAFIERKGANEHKDSQVELLNFFKQKMKNDIKPRYQYANIKMFTTVIPVLIQFPATIILFLLVREDSCNIADGVISVGECVALVVLSLVFHFIRAGLQGNNCFFYYFTYYMCGNVVVTILAFRGYVFANKYWKDAQCKPDNLYSILWYFMLFWVLHDCISMIGVLCEFGLNYNRIHFDLIPFLSFLIMGSVMFLQLPACIGQLYVVLNDESNINDTVKLSFGDTVSFIVVIWLQILCYRSMQTKFLRDFAIYPMYIFLFIIYIISIRSFYFWVTVDHTTVASVLFAVIFIMSVIYDTFLLVAPTFALPAAAWAFYGGVTRESGGMFRTMLISTIVFLFIQLPCCLMNLIPIWKGNVETISSVEGEALLLLSWLTLIIGYIYTYIFFDTDPKIREKTHPKIDLEPFKIYVKYIYWTVSVAVWLIVIHCFSFWSQESLRGVEWWFFLIWMLIFLFSSITPAVSIIWLMFCGQNKIDRWINNVYVGFLLFCYVFIQLPASVLQFAMIDFNVCYNAIGHTLDKSTAESFFILIFTFIQLILFYVITDIIGWGDEQDKMVKYHEDTQAMLADAKIEHRVTSWNYDRSHTATDWQDFGFRTREEYIAAVKAKKKEMRLKSRKKRFKKFNGPIFYVAFVVLVMIQFGLAVHSFTYWDKSDAQIDCGCTNENNPDIALGECTPANIQKLILFWLFLAWIVVYCLAPMLVFGLVVLRAGITYKDKRKDKKNKKKGGSNGDNEENDNNKKVQKDIKKKTKTVKKEQEEVYSV